MQGYQLITLADNIPITRGEYEKAFQIGASIREIMSMRSTVVETRHIDEALSKGSDIWKDTQGNDLYGKHIDQGVLSPSYEMVNNFRLHVGHFPGYRLQNITENIYYPSWTDDIAGTIDPAYMVDAPDWSIGAFLETTKMLPPDVICKPPVKLGEVGWLVNGGVVNRDIMACQERMSILYKSGLIDELRKRKTIRIVEIGGGYGALAYFLMQALPNVSYYICDLPMSLFYSMTYLSLTCKNIDHLLYRGKEELFDKRFGFVYVPNYLFDDLKIGEFDLAINTLSFAEMELNTVDSYSRGLSEMLRNRGYLYEQNFDNSHFKLPTHCNPQSVIPKYFNNKLLLAADGRWGIANLWFNKGNV